MGRNWVRSAVKVHILTAVTRPKNLPALQGSIFAANDLAPEVDVEWHRYEDLQREHVGGQHPKNIMLSRIDDGWVCILDDDTVMNPSYLRRIYKASKTGTFNAIVVSQRRTTNTLLQAKPENMLVGKVDAGQVCIRRDYIGDLLIPETYAGDGEWIECLLYGQPDILYLPQVLSLHNALTGIDVSEPPERMGAA